MKPIAGAHPWLFPDDAVFPVVSSDLHPLKLHARGLLGRGILSAVALHFVIFGAWLIQRGLSTGEISVQIPPVVERVVDLLPPPPSIQTRVDPAEAQPEPESILASAAGVPEPVVDFLAPGIDLRPNQSLVDEPTAVGPEDFSRTDQPLVIRSTLDTDPDPGAFNPVEEEPYPVLSPAPVYPEMARAAEVEGVVLVRAMVNKEGRIEKAFVISGHPMLDDAALAAIRTWVFKAAMQQHQPVKVWVTIPIRFVLH